MSTKLERISSLAILVAAGTSKIRLPFVQAIHRSCPLHTLVQTRTSSSIENVPRVDEVSYNVRQRSISKTSQVHTNTPSRRDTDWTPIRSTTTNQREKNGPIDTRTRNKRPHRSISISSRTVTRSSTTNRPRTAWPTDSRYHSHPIQHRAIPVHTIRHGSTHRWDHRV